MRELCDPTLQQRAKFVFTEPGVAGDAAHGEGIHGVVPGNGEDPDTVRHDDVLALSDDLKACLLQPTYGVLMVDARDSGHALPNDLNLTNHRTLKKLIARCEIFLNRVLDVREGFFLGRTLGPATRQAGDRDAVPFVRLE